MPKPTKPSRQELKTINSTGLFDYLKALTEHGRQVFQAQENGGKALDIGHYFREFFKEIYNIFNPNSKLRREDGATLLLRT